MRILLATGIYPPEIGGPATYVYQLSRELRQLGHDVRVLTYGAEAGTEEREDGVVLLRIAKTGGTLSRWNRYARALKEEAGHCDVMYAFSTLSVGIPLRIARLQNAGKGPLTVLRLGGDALWAYYTDLGGRKGLRAFYQFYPFAKFITAKLLRQFDAIIYSTTFQSRLAEYFFKNLPPHTVIENSLPSNAEPMLHERHDPLRLLYFGRFVRLKNLPALIHAVSRLPYVRLTIAGEGPQEEQLLELTKKLSLEGRINFLPAQHGEEKEKLFKEHDLLVMPSYTDISPNSAIEARGAGLPVLLSEETGLSAELTVGMALRPMRTTVDITRALLEAEKEYESWAKESAAKLPTRSWNSLAKETLFFFEERLQHLPHKQ